MKMSGFFTAVGTLLIIAFIITLFYARTVSADRNYEPEPTPNPSGNPVVNDLGETVYCSFRSDIFYNGMVIELDHAIRFYC